MTGLDPMHTVLRIHGAPATLAELLEQCPLAGGEIGRNGALVATLSTAAAADPHWREVEDRLAAAEPLLLAARARQCELVADVDLQLRDRRDHADAALLVDETVVPARVLTALGKRGVDLMLTVYRVGETGSS